MIKLNDFKFSEIEIGLKQGFCVKIFKKDVNSFSKITGDKNPLHINLEYAKKKILRGI